MKYIRTKDGIYSYKPTHDIDVDGFVVQHNLTGWDKPIMKEDIIKITDTIEELLDELVFDNFYHSRMTPIAMHTKENQEIIKGYLKQNIPCYGAIWTDKGLIYIAKMNEKGEMELL